MTPSTPSTSAGSNRLARDRDARVGWLLSMHPATAAMLVAVGWFPNRAKAAKRLRRLCLRRRIRLVGTLSRNAGGRPEHVYCRYRVKADALLHEVELTELCLRLHAKRILRGAHVMAKELRPDAEVWINGRMYYLELDRGTMGYTQIERRFRLYEESPHFVLWVCSTPVRTDGLRRRAERIHGTALFTTMDEAIANPHGEIWRDYAGNRASLPREQTPVKKPTK